jgi:hypothetical protein
LSKLKKVGITRLADGIRHAAPYALIGWCFGYLFGLLVILMSALGRFSGDDVRAQYFAYIFALWFVVYGGNGDDPDR